MNNQYAGKRKSNGPVGYPSRLSWKMTTVLLIVIFSRAGEGFAQPTATRAPSSKETRASGQGLPGATGSGRSVATNAEGMRPADKVAPNPLCKTPTEADYQRVCECIKFKKPGASPAVLWNFEEELWRLSCADLEGYKMLFTDRVKNKQALIEARLEAKRKIQAFWMAYRLEFKCRGYTEVTGVAPNVMRFALDKHFPTVIMRAAKEYGMDMNFKDTDGRTLLDFVDERKDSFARANYESEVKEYERVRTVLLKNGAKRASEL